MQQETNQHQEQPHILDQIVIPALPPEFHHSDIAEQYQDGEFTSRLDAEVADVLRACQPAEKSDEAALTTLSGAAASALKDLNCIALIQHGQILPVLDIEETTASMSAAQRAHLYHAAVRTLLEAIAAIYEEQAQKRKGPDDDNEGEHSYA